MQVREITVKIVVTEDEAIEHGLNASTMLQIMPYPGYLFNNTGMSWTMSTPVVDVRDATEEEIEALGYEIDEESE
jgi:hypothetical protein